MPARDNEVLALVNKAGLYATGIGYIDAHLLTAVRLVPDTQFWTRDKRLREIAERLSIAANPPDGRETACADESGRREENLSPSPNPA